MDGQLRLRREEKKAYESRVALTHGFYSSEMYCGGGHPEADRKSVV